MSDFFARNHREFLMMAGLLLLSGTFSGCETALFSLKAADLNRLRRRRSPDSRAILALYDDLGGFLMTVLFCNMVVNILFFAVSTVVAARLARTGGSGFENVIFGLGCLLCVIAFGEVTPKCVAASARVGVSRMTALPLYALHRALWPVRAALGGFVRAAERIAGVKPATRRVMAEELRLLLEASRGDGSISSSEYELMAGVFDLPELRVREIMTPRTETAMLALPAATWQALELAKVSGHSKLPVRDGESDEITGWVDAREIFASGVSGDIAPFVRKAPYVSELDRADQLIVLLRERMSRLAVVVDERGATVGIVTLWDVLSEIFGEIADEDGPAVEPAREVGKGEYVVQAGLAVRDWQAFFGPGVRLPRTATLGGLVMAILGRTPRQGDRVELGEVVIEVSGSSRNRATELRLLHRGRVEDGGGA